MSTQKLCSVENCTRSHYAKGYCGMHYQRIAAGKPIGTAFSKLRDRGTGTIKPNGYISHKKNGRTLFEHIFVAEKALGKRLPANAVVHHVDKNRMNNAPNNLVICPSSAYHNLIHQRMRALEASGYADWRKCKHCKQYDKPENLYLDKTAAFHKDCNNQAQRNRYLAKKQRSNNDSK